MYKRAILSITNRCNLRCLHCYNASARDISVEKKIEWINDDFACKLKELGVYHIGLTGGEPLLRYEHLLNYVNLFSKYHFYIVLTTNGIFLDDEKIEELTQRGVNLIQISVDGANKESHEFIRGEGTYEPIIKFFREDKYKKYNLFPMYTINKHNYKEIETYIEQMIMYGVSQIGFERYIPATGLNVELLELSPDILHESYEKIFMYENKIDIHVNDPLYTAFKLSKSNASMEVVRFIEEWKVGCSAGESSIYIDANGNLYPCTFSKDSVFNVCEADISTLSNNITYNCATEESKCSKCKYARVCGGCRAAALYKTNGSWGGNDPLCFIN